MVTIAPSLLAADFGRLYEEIDLVEQSCAKWLHFDIMDGHFVPNLSFGPEMVRQMRKKSKLFFDVHLMVEEAENFLPMFSDCGADLITVHYEACHDLLHTLRQIRQTGAKAGVSIKPNTKAQVLQPYLDKIDNILVMTVEPGFGGQKFMENQLQKITELRKMIAERPITLEVDGGINLETAKLCVAAGADVLVAGNAVFKDENPQQVISCLSQTGER